MRITSLADMLGTHEPYIKTHREQYGPDTLYRALAGQFVLGRDYVRAMKAQRIIKEDYARVLKEVDFLVTPTAPLVAPSLLHPPSPWADGSTGSGDPPGT